MARARLIRPEFFTDSTTGRLPVYTRLLYIASWTKADIQGVLEWDADQLRLAAFPYDPITSDQVRGMMDDLERSGRVAVFTHSGKTYGVIRMWSKHQAFTTGEKKNGPRFPPPPEEPSQTTVRPWSDKGQTTSLTLTPSPSPAAAAALRDKPPPQPSGQDMFDHDPGPLPVVCQPKRTLADLQAIHPVLVIFRDDRDLAARLLALFEFDRVSGVLSELTPAARDRPPGKQRVTISELQSALQARFKPEADDYRRAGLPVPKESA